MRSPHEFTITTPAERFGDLSQPIGGVDFAKFDRDFHEKGVDVESLKRFFLDIGFSQEMVDDMEMLKYVVLGNPL